MATLTDNIDASQRLIRVTTPGAAAVGLRFRIDDELLDLSGFDTTTDWLTRTARKTDHEYWLVNRGVGESVAASHLAGATLTGAVAASVSGETLAEPAPFAGLGAAANPAAFVEPTTATPEAIAQAMIDAGLMEAS